MCPIDHAGRAQINSGIVDPVAALTDRLEAGPIAAPGIPAPVAAQHAPPPPPDHLARNGAILTIGAAATILATAYIIGLARRKKGH